MTVLKFEPFREFDLFDNKLLKYFEDQSKPDNEYTQTYIPKIDISEDEKNIFIEAEFPGLSKNDVNISIEDDVLTIEGEKKSGNQDKDKKFLRKERQSGFFKKSFTLPEYIDQDSVQASLENGVLVIELLKKQPETVRERVISVK
ncbi:MAG: Hsp20/alpha crystallin family protein [Ignavibacteriaceae bacterium]